MPNGEDYMLLVPVAVDGQVDVYHHDECEQPAQREGDEDLADSVYADVDYPSSHGCLALHSSYDAVEYV